MKTETEIENQEALAPAGIETELEVILDFIANIVASLAWPVIVLVIALSFRSHIVAAFNNLKSISYGGAKAVFEKELNKATERAKAIEEPDSQTAKENNERVGELLNMAAASPTGAIIEAWKDIEQNARDVAEGSGLPLGGNPARPYFNLQKFLSDNDLLPKAEINTFRELRMIRNRAAHSSDFEITVDQARRYVSLADRLIDAIKTSAIIRKT